MVGSGALVKYVTCEARGGNIVLKHVTHLLPQPKQTLHVCTQLGFTRLKLERSMLTTTFERLSNRL